ncbi:hypothetical protein [Streptomyces sp. NPDC059759]|uniref:hypothetical protein n=1 Tax=Streptomyces sp. NPDC059759 TaxID=3346936 RepID=UPI0036512814
MRVSVSIGSTTVDSFHRSHSADRAADGSDPTVGGIRSGGLDGIVVYPTRLTDGVAKGRYGAGAGPTGCQ